MNIFKSIYRYFVPAPTVTSIMSSFQKQQDALNALVSETNTRCEDITGAVRYLQEQRTELLDEQAKAERVSAKLAELIA